MLTTPMKHFTEDLLRAENLRVHGASHPAGQLRDDILRSSVMMAVGACDAYFCDAYGDILSRVLRAKEKEPTIPIPDRLSNLKVPAIAVIGPATGGWRWRMAARELIEKENVLSLAKIRELLKQFCVVSNGIITQKTIGPLITHKDAKVRCLSITATDYRKLNSQGQSRAREKAVAQFELRYTEIFQRRHDCIHNCDRPKVAQTQISDSYTKKLIEDAKFLVFRVHDILISEFPVYLKNCGFSAVTRNQVLI